jgi:hypothetical protein
MKRIVQVDAQGRDELMELVERTNREIREAEDEIVERGGSKPNIAWRVIALPASEAEVAAAKAEKAREEGKPPL